MVAEAATADLRRSDAKSKVRAIPFARLERDVSCLSKDCFEDEATLAAR
jgi:hypothetical protein